MSSYSELKKILKDNNIKGDTHSSTIEVFYKKFPRYKEIIKKIVDKNNCLINVTQATRWLLGGIKLRRCEVCGKRLDSKTSMRQNARFCSMNCRKTPLGKKLWNEAKEKALMEKYGVINVGQLQSIKNKVKETNLQRYGVDNAAKRKEIQEKIAQTNLKRYGVRNPFQLEEVKAKVKIINQSEERNVKIRKSWNKRAADYRINLLAKCNLEFLPEFKYERMRVNNTGWLETKLRCTKCNKIFNYKFNSDKDLSRACPYCHPFSQSKPEEDIVNFIKTCGLKEVITNNRSLIHPQELDIYIPSKNLAIEYNGLYWHSETCGKDKNYHLNKTKLCAEKGVQLIHIFEDEWIKKQQIVKSRLKHLLGLTPYKIAARKCEVRLVKNKIASNFLDKYHIQGSINSSINLGLFYKNKLVALMTFGKSRFNKNYEYELLRYCSVFNFSIVGGASKLFSYFIKKYNPTSVISYADRRWSNGNLYKQLGFNELKSSSPAYFYVYEGVRCNRIKFQKHKLSNILEFFDPDLSEFENMMLNRYHRVWDCGNLCFGYYNINRT